MPVVSPKPRLTLVTDAAAASELAQTETLSFSALYDRHAGYVAGLAGRILGRNDEVQDVVQDVFLVVHRQMGALRNPAAAKGWLAKVTVRQASRRLRWRRVRLFLNPAWTVDAELVAGDGEPGTRP